MIFWNKILKKISAYGYGHGYGVGVGSYGYGPLYGPLPKINPKLVDMSISIGQCLTKFKTLA